MSTVYLHIGMPKTGTTALQNFLVKNREALAQAGACYPDLGPKYYRVSKVRNAHFLAVAHVDAEGNRSYNLPGPDYEAILEEISALGQRFEKIILSDESLWRVRADQPDFWKKLKADLAEKALGLCVIVYLRRQDQFVQSVYRQKIKASYTSLSFHDYLSSLDEIYALDYLPCIAMLDSALGRDCLVIRVYEKKQYHGNLYADFLNIAGISFDDSFQDDNTQYNVSLNGPRLELQRILNELPENPFFTKALYGSMHDIQRDSPIAHERDSLFSAQELEEFLAQFEESNRELAEKYLGRADGTLFYDPVQSGLPTGEVSTEDLLRDTILFYGRAVQKLEKQNEELTKRLEAAEKCCPKLRELEKCSILYRLRRKLRHLMGNDKPDSNS